jgi:carbonic anhydrase
MPRFAAGVIRFQNEVYPEKKELFERLSLGQSPEALFITCSDARVETAMITQTDPGDLFICRNAGNIVPKYDNYSGAMTASIEFAVATLKVPHIVVCGHTECGAMHGALNPDSLADLVHVKGWLRHAQPAVDVVLKEAAQKSDAERMHLMLEQNVILQLEHLKTHPSVAAQIDAGALQLHGWIYDIKTGDVHAYDEAAVGFVPVSERYAAEVAKLATSDSTDSE